MIKIITVLPTRGLVYAKTMQGFIDNAQDCDAGITMPIGFPLPEGHNQGVKEALFLGATHIWFLEEDNEAPRGVLRKMFEMNEDIVVLDYNVGGGVSHIKRDEKGEVMWAGVGCALIKVEVFEKIAYPWFECNHVYNEKGEEIGTIPVENLGKKYGGHDVHFFHKKCKEAGFKVTVLPEIKGDHYRAAEIEKRELNNGAYTITSL